ncbi:hypothetical protein Acr_06g0014940 [Actinidia rufa]|uniref:Uncharacterized protein n=1 Tax=Actinidia rufa TaxID=165716 RepID=A0A7J0ESU5_9ERIC|nr:hypothetical protein Acr_06g0014940 [Actinidia rufa]
MGWCVVAHCTHTTPKGKSTRVTCLDKQSEEIVSENTCPKDYEQLWNECNKLVLIQVFPMAVEGKALDETRQIERNRESVFSSDAHAVDLNAMSIVGTYFYY